MKNAALLLALVVACGGGSGKKSGTSNTGGDPATPTPMAGDGGVYGGVEYGGYIRTPELTAFHDAIATKTTVADACPASAQLHAAAGAIAASAPPPGASADRWAGEANELLAVSEDFITNCNATDEGAKAFDLRSMHRSFQRLLLQIK